VEDADQLARQMVATSPEVIVVHGRDVNAVHRAKPAGPVAFAFSGNPVDAGFVESLARPGTNFTGVSLTSLELAGKRIELLRELAPQIRRLAVLARPEHPGEHRERAATEESSASWASSWLTFRSDQPANSMAPCRPSSVATATR